MLGRGPESTLLPVMIYALYLQDTKTPIRVRDQG